MLLERQVRGNIVVNIPVHGTDGIVRSQRHEH
jgi:hypothetical protein